MAAEERKQELIKGIYDAVLNMDEDAAREISEAVVRAEAQVRLQEALNQMDEVDREIIALRNFEELTNKQAAEVLGLDPSAVLLAQEQDCDADRKGGGGRDDGGCRHPRLGVRSHGGAPSHGFAYGHERSRLHR